MALPNVFEKSTVDNILARLEKITPETQPLWGTMDAAKMLAHLNVAYDLTYGKTVPNNSAFKKMMLKLFVKKIVTSEKPYPQNGRTAPEFIISDARDFDKEKTILINYIKITLDHGKAYFEGKESTSFGKMTSEEWNNQFFKHLDHHFRQFGV